MGRNQTHEARGFCHLKTKARTAEKEMNDRDLEMLETASHDLYPRGHQKPVGFLNIGFFLPQTTKRLVPFEN